MGRAENRETVAETQYFDIAGSADAPHLARQNPDAATRGPAITEKE